MLYARPAPVCSQRAARWKRTGGNRANGGLTIGQLLSRLCSLLFEDSQPGLIPTLPWFVHVGQLPHGRSWLKDIACSRTRRAPRRFLKAPQLPWLWSQAETPTQASPRAEYRNRPPASAGCCAWGDCKWERPTYHAAGFGSPWGNPEGRKSAGTGTATPVDALCATVMPNPLPQQPRMRQTIDSIGLRRSRSLVAEA